MGTFVSPQCVKMLVTASILLVFSLGHSALGQVPPPIIRNELPEEVVRGSDVTFRCEAAEGDRPGQTYSFYFYGASQTQADRRRVSGPSSDLRYTISGVTGANSGSYQCEYSGEFGAPLFSNSLQMTVVETPSQPTIRLVGEPEAAIGSSRRIICESPTGGAVVYTFFKDRVEVQKAPSTFYRIQSVTVDDYGVYQCTAGGPGGEAQAADSVELIEPSEPPTLSSNQPETTIVSGSLLTLTCTSSTGDDASITYTFLKRSTVVRPASRDTTYTISSVSTGDSGPYTCRTTTTSSAGSSTSTTNSNSYRLSVVDFPQTPSLTPNGQQEVQLGSSVSMTCATTTGGSITYKFFRDTVEVQSSASTTYVIQDFSMADYGTYTCHAAGSVATSFSEDSQELTAPPGLLQTLLKLVFRLLGK